MSAGAHVFKRSENQRAHDLALNLKDPDLISIFRELVCLCDGLVPSRVVLFGRDPTKHYEGSSHDAENIWIVTDEKAGQRKPAEIVVSMAHEVGHLLDPPVLSDRSLAEGSEGFRQRQEEREQVAWEWAEKFLGQRPSWDRYSGVFEQARKRAIDAYANSGRRS